MVCRFATPPRARTRTHARAASCANIIPIPSLPPRKWEPAQGTVRLCGVARLLILGGGRCGVELAREVGEEGHAGRIVTRGEARRAEIEAAGAECWIGDPDRLGTLRGALEGVTIACWLMGSASGSEEQLLALHGSRLRSFLGQAIDTTMRGFVYEATGSVPPGLLREGERISVEECARNEIPLQVLLTTAERPSWQEAARYAVHNLLKTDRDS